MEAAVVANETRFCELSHEEIDSGARVSDHLRQSLLGDLGDYLLRPTPLTTVGNQKKSAGQPFSLELKS